jgi:hypothetical protein
MREQAGHGMTDSIKDGNDPQVGLVAIQLRAVAWARSAGRDPDVPEDPAVAEASGPRDRHHGARNLRRVRGGRERRCRQHL